MIHLNFLSTKKNEIFGFLKKYFVFYLLANIIGIKLDLFNLCCTMLVHTKVLNALGSINKLIERQTER